MLHYVVISTAEIPTDCEASLVLERYMETTADEIFTCHRKKACNQNIYLWEEALVSVSSFRGGINIVKSI